ncbi:hypothetical protein [Natrinema altunense]|uniref:Uncharacterized protein n=1 Tax=Natrinema altunense (strain JCM 12890 / CGMCC 1.3731 / AJ2) TaxID=1227494 RepID=L9Z9Q3_NATA2|nr:hypothetical protein [Natrinema altunense]ELY82706.1 hypothetical protein C485_18936 [Natrinema altunense JCM 12890]
MTALNRLNILAASALGMFFGVSLVMVGLAGDVVGFLESHRFLPLAMSYLLMAIAFLSSGSRDPSQYYGIEKAYVVFVMGFMALYAWQPWVDMMASYDPFSAIVSLVLMSIATAILAR